MTCLGLELKTFIWRFVYNSFEMIFSYQNTQCSLTSIDSVLDSSQSERYHISLEFPEWTDCRSTDY